MKLKEIAINTVYKHPLSILNKYAWCVQEQYWHYLGKYETGQWQKVIVQVSDDPALMKIDYQLPRSIADVAVIIRYFDITNFLDLDKGRKKKALLDLLHDSMLHLATEYQWDKEVLTNAFNQCIESGLDYRFKVKDKDFKSPTRQFIGSIHCIWDLDNFKAIGVIADKDGVVLKEETLINTEPYHGEFIYYSKCKWDDPYTFSLYSKEGKRWSIAVIAVV